MSIQYESGFGRYSAKTHSGAVQLVCANAAYNSWTSTKTFSEQYRLGFDMAFKAYWLALSKPCEVCCKVADMHSHNYVCRRACGAHMSASNLVVLCRSCMQLKGKHSLDRLYSEVSRRMAPAGEAKFTGTKFTRLPYKGPDSPRRKGGASPKGFHKGMARKVYSTMA